MRHRPDDHRLHAPFTDVRQQPRGVDRARVCAAFDGEVQVVRRAGRRIEKIPGGGRERVAARHLEAQVCRCLPEHRLGVQGVRIGEDHGHAGGGHALHAGSAEVGGHVSGERHIRQGRCQGDQRHQQRQHADRTIASRAAKHAFNEHGKQQACEQVDVERQANRQDVRQKRHPVQDQPRDDEGRHGCRHRNRAPEQGDDKDQRQARNPGIGAGVVNRAAQRKRPQHRGQHRRGAHLRPAPLADRGIQQEQDERDPQVGVRLGEAAAWEAAEQAHEPGGGQPLELVRRDETQEIGDVGVLGVDQAVDPLRPEKLDRERDRRQCDEDRSGDREASRHARQAIADHGRIHPGKQADPEEGDQRRDGQHLLPDQELGRPEQTQQCAHPNG